MTRKRGAGDARELIDGGAAGGEIRHHLRRHLGRIGRDAVRRHAVIAGEHQDLDLLERGGAWPCQCASQATSSSSRPRLPGGLVSVASRRATAALAAG